MCLLRNTWYVSLLARGHIPALCSCCDCAMAALLAERRSTEGARLHYLSQTLPDLCARWFSPLCGHQTHSIHHIIWLRTPGSATGVIRARSVPGESPECFPKPGCPRECPNGCLWGPSGLGSGLSKKCTESVPECLGYLFPGTLSGHFLDTPGNGARRAPETPRGRPGASQ